MKGLEGTLFEIFQYISLVLAILVIYFETKNIIVSYKRKGHLLTKAFILGLPTILLMLNGVAFYTGIIICKNIDCHTIGSLFFTKWSTLLRMHGYAIFLLLALGRAYINRIIK